MDDIFFGPSDIASNQSLASTSSGSSRHVYSAEEISLMLAALGAMIASIVYSVKNVKHSSCCAGFWECDQITELRSSRRSQTTASTHSPNLTLDPAPEVSVV